MLTAQEQERMADLKECIKARIKESLSNSDERQIANAAIALDLDVFDKDADTQISNLLRLTIRSQQ